MIFKCGKIEETFFMLQCWHFVTDNFLRIRQHCFSNTQYFQKYFLYQTKIKSNLLIAQLRFFYFSISMQENRDSTRKACNNVV